MSGRRPTGLALIERSAEVEASLWRRLRFEDDDGCRELLFDRHLKLARALAWREYRRRPAHGLDRADFEQLALSGLLEAIDRYDPMLGTPFSAFARHRIRGAIADGLSRSSESAAQFTFRRRLEIERMRSLTEHASLAASDPLNAVTEIAVSLAIGFLVEGGHAADPYQSSGWRDLEHRLEAEIERLPAPERSVVTRHYRNGLAFGEIARLMGLSNGRISQLHHRALMSLRRRLNGQE